MNTQYGMVVKEHSPWQAVAHGSLVVAAALDDDFRRWYTRSPKNWLVAHVVAAGVAGLLCCAWQKNRLTAA
jgi:hypothetical protein